MALKHEKYLHHLHAINLTQQDKFEVINIIWKLVNAVFDQYVEAYA